MYVPNKKKKNVQHPPKEICDGCLRCEMIHVFARYIIDRVYPYEDKDLSVIDFSATLQPRKNNAKNVPIVDTVWANNVKYDAPMNNIGVQFASQTLKTCINYNLHLDEDLMNAVHDQLLLGFEYDRDKYDDTESGYRKVTRSMAYHPSFNVDSFSWRSEQPHKEMTSTAVLEHFKDMPPLHCLTLANVSPVDALSMKRLLVRDKSVHKLRQQRNKGTLSDEKYKEMMDRLLHESPQELYANLVSVKRNLFSPPGIDMLRVLVPFILKRTNSFLCNLRIAINDIRKTVLDKDRLSNIIRSMVGKSVNNYSIVRFARDVETFYARIPVKEEFTNLPYFLNKTVKVTSFLDARADEEFNNEQEYATYAAIKKHIMQSRCNKRHDLQNEVRLLEALRKLCVCLDVLLLDASVCMADAHQLLAQHAPWSVATGGIARFIINAIACSLSFPPLLFEYHNQSEETHYSNVMAFALQHRSSLLFAGFLAETMRDQLQFQQAFHLFRMRAFVANRYGKSVDAFDVARVLQKKWMKLQGAKQKSTLSFGAHVSHILLSRSRAVEFMFGEGGHEKLYENE